MTAPDPVTDVWELLWTAACDYRDAAGPDRSEARLIAALMPIVEEYADQRSAEAWDAGYAAAQLDADEEPYSDSPLRAAWQPRQNPHREHEHTWVSTYADGSTSHELCTVCRERRVTR